MRTATPSPISSLSLQAAARPVHVCPLCAQHGSSRRKSTRGGGANAGMVMAGRLGDGRAWRTNHDITSSCAWSATDRPSRGVPPVVKMAHDVWYQQSSDEVFAHLQAPREGLTCEDAEARLRQVGYNQLEDVKALPLWRIFLGEFKSPLIYILLVAAAIAFLLGKFVDMVVILASVTINSIIGTIQQARAERAIGSLKALQALVAIVRRDGVDQEIDARLLAPGDLVLLRAGAQVPADLRLLEVVELTIDESSLTGESMPARKTVEPILTPYLTPGDQTNMAFMGTVITDGTGAGIVVATGAHTQFGRIASAVKAVHREPSPLETRIARFGRFIALSVIALAGVVVLLGVLLREAFTAIVFIAISVAVAAVPEGLPVVVTIALAIGVRRMAHRQAIIRKLAAVETLGSCTIICSDKTGTLTENQMTVQRLWVADHEFTFSGVGYAPEGEIHDPQQFAAQRAEVEMALRVGALCNDTQVYREDGTWRVQGDPTEAALLVAAEKVGITRVEQLERFPWVDSIPFKSERQFMATLHQREGGSLICVKGSVERILAIAGTSYPDCALTPAVIHRVAERFAAEGLRVLALAVKELPVPLDGISPEEIDAGGFAVAGLVGILDPPRAEAAEAVAQA
ncbi:MAG TPA: HAD-IC family P-type ATPase, partial [Armatimonadota bacterium]|nr:HAD-IC family P-type ATPase [Armatimonadota bacterium]